MSDGSGTSHYVYDSFGRLTSSTDGAGATTTYQYDLNGAKSGVTYELGHNFAMSHDQAGQMTSLSDWLGNTTQFTYDAAGRLIGSHVLNGRTNTVQWDAAGHIIYARFFDAASSQYASFSYTRASDGRITGSQSTGVGQSDQSFSYDSQGRLTSENGGAISYDSRNNLLSNALRSGNHYDGADQLTSSFAGAVPISFSYDANGQRLSSSSALGVTNYSYDGAGNLVQFSSGVTSVSYGFNGDGARVSSSSGGVTRHFTWDYSTDLGRSSPVLVTIPTGDCGPSISAASGPSTFLDPQTGQSGRKTTTRLDYLKVPLMVLNGTSYIYGPDGFPLEQIDAANGKILLS